YNHAILDIKKVKLDAQEERFKREKRMFQFEKKLSYFETEVDNFKHKSSMTRAEYENLCTELKELEEEKAKLEASLTEDS
ncbi:hypothetical protein KA005_62090, partial [bacterium]|nr:hypothetical protein [bacterium]